MSKFTDHLWRDLVREHGPTLAHADRPEPARAGGAGVFRRPRILAGSTLGLAGVVAALLVVLGGSAAPPAFAITKQGDGSVLVHLNQTQNLPQVNQKLSAMGTGEQITIYEATGATPVSGAVTCTPGPGAGPPRTPVQVLQGTDGTEVISPGQTGDNTGVGTWHLARCTVAPDADTGRGTGNTGNTGAG